MNKRNLFILLTLMAGLIFATFVVVSAGGLVEKPYAEGEGALSTGQRSSLADPEKPYVEGEGAVSTGASVGENSDKNAEPEGMEGSAGTGSLEKVNAHLASGLSNLAMILQFSGVSDDGEQGSSNRKEATSIHCTNVYTGNVTVEVQIYQWNGTDVYTGTVNMPPNRTFTFSTQNTTIYFDDVLLGGSPGTPAIFQGSGRVLADNPAVVCSAQVLDPLNYPPVFVVGLEMYQP
ncbi:MAG: hypothetical protein H6636_04630 [Anaerolineales bacterium]|nr:hypothetical protein [Anaerolineales bacterium]